MHKQASVRGAIQAQAQSYKLYIDGILEHNQLKGLIDWVSGQVPTFVFSGITRNFLLGYLNNRDIDFVVIDSPRLHIPISQLRDVTILKNKFDGYKLLTQLLTIDVWDVEKTWGIVQEGMRGTAHSLMNTAFFNFSAIVYDYNKGRFYISDEFCRFYKTHVMEVVYARNPRIETCIVNALYYADRYEFVIGDSLRKWVVKHYVEGMSFKAAQESRFNEIVYTDELLRAFAAICGKSEIYRHGTVTLYNKEQKIVLKFDK
jgi:hypothetical protein